VGRVRLDQIADEVDLARNTLYSHFGTKEELVEAIVRPALEQGLGELRELSRLKARERIDGILKVYLLLWRHHSDALRVAYGLQAFTAGPLVALHQSFAEGVLAGLKSASRAGILRVREPLIAARVIMRVAIPLLELYGGYDDAEQLFLQSMRGLLVVDRTSGSSSA